MDAEQAFLRRIAELGMTPGYHPGQFRIRTTRLSNLIATLLNEGWAVLGNRLAFHQSGDVSVALSRGID